MKFKAPKDLAGATVADIEAAIATASAEGSEIVGLAADKVTQAHVDDAKALAEFVTSARAELASRTEAASALVNELASAGAAFAPVEPAPVEPLEAAAVVPPVAPVAPVEPAQLATIEPAAPIDHEAIFKAMFSAAKENGLFAAVPAAPDPVESLVASAARVTMHPQAIDTSQFNRGKISLTAAADVPGFGHGQVLELGIRDLGNGVVNRLQGFGKPNGNGKTESLAKYPVATIHRDFPQDLVIGDVSEQTAQSIFMHAADESRLPGGSLVAAGWCAPSQIIYDLCENETTDGMLTTAEVQIERGGAQITLGPDFATLYAATGFIQTEAQAIAGTTKPCYEVACTSFQDYRLDAIGTCIKVPILTQVGYPELVDRTTRGALVAHEHRKNNRKILAIQTALGSALVMDDMGSTVGSTLGSVEFIIEQEREKYRMGRDQTMEVVLPMWARGALRLDLSMRNGVDLITVTDEQLNAHFAARKAAVQFVYDWQQLGVAAAVNNYPTTMDILIYPSGAFVTGVAPIINLSAVYDAASLAVNTYTGLFFEEGMLVARTCFGGRRITIAVCGAGRTGSPNIVECGTSAQT